MNGMLYPKTSAGDSFDQYGDGTVRPTPGITGGTNPSSGPTTMSTRFYPKGRTRLVTQMNPQKVAVTKIYVGGVD
jgi:hypothetical protein